MNGFALACPLNARRTFSAGELTRAGMRRIRETPASSLNDGYPGHDDLTLQPFDAIVLPAEPRHAWARLGRENCPGGPARTW